MNWQELSSLNSTTVNRAFELPAIYTPKGKPPIGTVAVNVRRVPVIVGDDNGGQFEEIETHLVIRTCEVAKPSRGDSVAMFSGPVYLIDTVIDTTSPDVTVVRVVEHASKN